MRTLSLLLIGFISASFAFNPQTIQIFEGEVLSIQKFRFVNRPTPTTQLNVHTKSGDVIVEVGPEWYLEAEGINFALRDQITVEGSLVKDHQKSFVIAKTLHLNGRKIQLRTEEGTPLWFSTQPSKG